MNYWYLYLLRCDGGALYTGIAKNPFRRFEQHLAGKGARYTKIYPPQSLEYIERIEGQSSALKRERSVKSWKKQKKEALCAGCLGSLPH